MPGSLSKPPLCHIDVPCCQPLPPAILTPAILTPAILTPARPPSLHPHSRLPSSLLPAILTPARHPHARPPSSRPPAILTPARHPHATPLVARRAHRQHDIGCSFTAAKYSRCRPANDVNRTCSRLHSVWSRCLAYNLSERQKRQCWETNGEGKCPSMYVAVLY